MDCQLVLEELLGRCFEALLLDRARHVAPFEYGPRDENVIVYFRILLLSFLVSHQQKSIKVVFVFLLGNTVRQLGRSIDIIHGR